jgi:hypothetical protein
LPPGWRGWTIAALIIGGAWSLLLLLLMLATLLPK